MVKNICSCRGYRFNFQHPHVIAQTISTVPKEPNVFFWPGTRHMHGTQTYMQAQHLDIGRHFQAKQEKTDLSEDQEGQPEWTGRTRGQGLDADNAEASSVFFRIWYYGRWWTVDYRRAREEGGDEAPGSMLHHCPGLGCGEGTGAEWIYSGSVEGKRVR